MNGKILLAGVGVVLACAGLGEVIPVRAVAHRGLWDEKVAENTVEAIRRAYEAGAECVETDFHEEKDGRMMVQLVNVNGNHYDEKSLTEDFIPPVLDVVLKVRLDKRPKAVYQQPDGKKLKFRWNDGCCEFTVPRVDIHSTVVFE